MDLQKFYDNVLKDLKVELLDEFDMNFQRKAFFGNKWPKEKLTNRRGSLMARTNKLRGSINADIVSDGIKFTSSLPYASIHNEGGTITVTKKMKSFFWHMYYKAAGSVSKSFVLKDGTRHLFISSESKEKMEKQAISKSKKAQQLNAEAQQWKNLALMKVGQKMTIPARKFIGNAPEVKSAIESVINDNLEEFNEEIMNKLKQ